MRKQPKTRQEKATMTTDVSMRKVTDDDWAKAIAERKATLRGKPITRRIPFDPNGPITRRLPDGRWVHIQQKKAR